MTRIFAYTDGACSGNPGPGGWGAILEWNGHRKELKGGEPDTTKNRMEMLAAIRALEAIRKSDRSVILITDSVYLRDGITKWIHGWKRRGWKTADKKPVKNVDLWQALETLTAQHTIEWRWVKGHAGDPGNERADELAREGLAEARAR